MKKVMALVMSALMATSLLAPLSKVKALELSTAVPAFPGAEGGGKYTTGGRGYDVYEVTNLNDAGPGSLRDAVSVGNRTIVFRVSGTIHLKSLLKITGSNLTIAGQTAPGDGICIADFGAQIADGVQNVIIRYVRFRPGSANIDSEPDGIWGRKLQNIMLDHISSSWSTDEALSFYGNTNFTLQYSIISESLTMSGHFKGRHGYGGIWGGANATFHHNLIMDHTSRLPRVEVGGNTTQASVDLRNNVIYNWGFNSTYGGDTSNVNIINNYYKPGPGTIKEDGGKSVNTRIANPGIVGKTSSWYINGNFMEGSPEVTADNSKGVFVTSGSESTTSIVNTPFEMEGNKTENLTTQTAAEAYATVLANAGAVLPRRDAVDARLIEDVKNGTGRFINREFEVGGYPEYQSVEAPVDTDHDGMPDAWETENSLNPNSADDGKAVAANGYTNLENYMNSLVPSTIATDNPTVKIDTPTYNQFLSTGVSTTIKATASDKDQIAKVEFYDGIVKLGEATTAPYIFNWSNPTEGIHYITARAYDTLGNSTQSTSTPVQVNDPAISSPWGSQDIGSVPAPGTSSKTGDIITVKGTGVIKGTSDAFQYTYQKLNGDGSIVAKVESMGNPDNSAVAGLMIRENLDADSAFAAVSTSYNKTDQLTPYAVQMPSRQAKGAVAVAPTTDTVDNKLITTTANLPGIPYTKVPVWLKITRSGDLFSSYTSTDGISWTQVGQKTIPMAADVYVGMAVDAAKNSSSLINYNTVKYSNVSLSGLITPISEANTLAVNTTIDNKTGEVDFAVSDSKHPQDTVTILITNTKDNSVAYIDQATLDSNGNYTFTTTLNDGSYVGAVNGKNGKVVIQPFTVQIEKESFEWKFTEFGASTSAANNTVSVDDTNKTVNVTSGTKDATKTGGKITGSHDGISYYYTEIDPSKNFEISADIKVNYFAKATPDNQEGFGIMARDAIGNIGDSSTFASNMVMVGGYRGLVQSVFRNNVKDSTGAGAVMEDVFKFGERPANDGTATYKMTMKKTNTGYHVSVDNGTEKIYYRPKQLEVINKDKIYVGFFAARVASITVSNVSMKTSDVATDPAGLPEPPKPVAPAVNITSRAASSSANYDLKVSPNVNGTMQVKLAGTELYNGAAEAGKELVVKSTLVNGDNSFEITFTPGANENVTNYASVTVNKVVTYRSYGLPGGAIYASQTGSVNGTGSENDPIDIYSAVNFAGEGQTIYVRGGVYNLTTPMLIERGNNGTADKPKVLSAYPGERPVFDFGKVSQGFALAGDYWRIYGIDVTKASSTGFKVSGNNNVVELVNTYANGDTGLQISGSSTDSRSIWPANNLIKNCTSYDNRDASENNADGFAAKLQVGPGNKFTGCIAHNNTDDGWDLYSKLETGPIEPVVIENSVTYGNGTLSDGTATLGDGNGFKLGGEGLAVPHVLRNSLSFKNKSNGVTNNSDPAIIVENVTSVDNGKSNFEFHYYTNATITAIARNNISFRTSTGIADEMPNLASEDNYFYDGTASVNASGKQLVASDFKSVTAPASFERNLDGSISAGDYMVLVSKTEPTPTPSTTPDVTPSPTPTPTATPDVTPSPTPTPSTTPDVTPSPTPTPSTTPDVTPSPTPTPSATPDVTPSPTPTPSVTPDVTPLPTPTPSVTPDVTPITDEGDQKENKVDEIIVDITMTPANIKEIVINAKPEEKVIINAQEKPVIEAELFKYLKGTDKEVSFRLVSQGKTIVWSFNCKDIKDINTSVDLTLNSGTVNKELINIMAPKVDIISFKNHGELPAPMKVSIPIDTAKFDRSKPIYFYYYNEISKKAELVGDNLTAYKVGEVYYIDVKLTHNSDFFMTDVKIGETDTKVTNKLVKTGSFIDFNVAALIGIFVIGIGFIMYRTKKEN